MSFASPYFNAVPPVISPLTGYNPAAIAMPSIQPSIVPPLNPYSSAIPSPYSMGGASPFVSAQAFAGVTPSMYSPVTSYPTLSSIIPPAAYATANAAAYNPATVASANTSASNGNNEQLLLMLIMLLAGKSQGSTTPAPAAKTTEKPPAKTADKKDTKDSKPIPPAGQPDTIKHKGRTANFKQVLPNGQLQYEIPLIGVNHKGTQDGLINVDPQTGQQSVVQEVQDDPLTFDIGGDGIHTTDEKVTAKINGKEQTVNNIGKDDAVLTLNGEILGDKTDLSPMGITEKPKDAQDAMRLIAEKAAKEGAISDASNLSPQDLETLHKHYGLSMRKGDLNAQDQSFADVGINGVNLSKAPSQTIQNFDGKNNNLSVNGTTFTRNDGTQGGVGDIWYKSQAA